MIFTFTVADGIYNRERGKLADCVLVFEDHCDLGGLQLQGFSVCRKLGGDRPLYVTFPGRTYQVNGERRQFALLRPAPGSSGQAKQQLEDQILRAFAIWQTQLAEVDTPHLDAVARRLGVVPGGSTPSTS